MWGWFDDFNEVMDGLIKLSIFLAILAPFGVWKLGEILWSCCLGGW